MTCPHDDEGVDTLRLVPAIGALPVCLLLTLAAALRARLARRQDA